MKIGLILTPNWGIEAPHLAFGLLQANLKRYGFDVNIYDFNIETYRRYNIKKEFWNQSDSIKWLEDTTIEEFLKNNPGIIDAFIKRILEDNLDVIGFSLYITTKEISLMIAERIKLSVPKKTIVFGGQLCSVYHSLDRLMQENPFIDAIVIGEGEETFLEFLKSLKDKKEIVNCPGLILRNGQDIQNFGLRSPILNLDELPYADFTGFDFNDYELPYKMEIFSSRGCPYPCVYCSTKLFWERYRSMSAERVFNEIRYQLKRHPQITFLEFTDHVVNAQMQRLDKLCDLLIDAKRNRLDGLNWENLAWRAQAVLRGEMTCKFMEKVKKSGCVELEYGMESGSQRILELMRKPIDVKQSERVIRDTFNVGISARVNFMFGFPGENEEDFQLTLDFLKRNAEFLSQVHPSESFCCIDEGTYLCAHKEKYGVSTEEFHPHYWESIDKLNTYELRLLRHQRFCEIAEYFGIKTSLGGGQIKKHRETLLEKYRQSLESKT